MTTTAKVISDKSAQTKLSIKIFTDYHYNYAAGE